MFKKHYKMERNDADNYRLAEFIKTNKNLIRPT